MGALVPFEKLNAELATAVRSGTADTCLRISGGGQSAKIETGQSQHGSLELHQEDTDERSFVSLSISLGSSALPPEAVQILCAITARSTATHIVEARLQMTDSGGKAWECSSEQQEVGLKARSHLLCCEVPRPSDGFESSFKCLTLHIRFSARTSTITISDLRVYAIRWDGAELAEFEAPSLLRQHFVAGGTPRQLRCLSAESSVPQGMLASPSTLRPGCYLNYDCSHGQTVKLSKSSDCIELDFSEAQHGKWRTIEFRFLEQNNQNLSGLRRLFEDKKVAYTGPQPWAMVFQAELSAPDARGSPKLWMNLRPYDADVRPLSDYPDVARLCLSPTRSRHWCTLDAAQAMPRSAVPNALGLVLHVPSGVPVLRIHQLAAACGVLAA